MECGHISKHGRAEEHDVQQQLGKLGNWELGVEQSGVEQSETEWNKNNKNKNKGKMRYHCTMLHDSNVLPCFWAEVVTMSVSDYPTPPEPNLHTVNGPPRAIFICLHTSRSLWQNCLIHPHPFWDPHHHATPFKCYSSHCHVFLVLSAIMYYGYLS